MVQGERATGPRGPADGRRGAKRWFRGKGRRACRRATGSGAVVQGERATGLQTGDGERSGGSGGKGDGSADGGDGERSGGSGGKGDGPADGRRGAGAVVQGERVTGLQTGDGERSGGSGGKGDGPTRVCRRGRRGAERWFRGKGRRAHAGRQTGGGERSGGSGGKGDAALSELPDGSEPSTSAYRYAAVTLPQFAGVGCDSTGSGEHRPRYRFSAPSPEALTGTQAEIEGADTHQTGPAFLLPAYCH